MKTNKELGAVYLEVDGLDKERFKELTKGMEFENGDSNHILKYSFIENYITISGRKGTWIGIHYKYSVEKSSKKITLDELEQLLKPKKDMKIEDVVVISKEDYQRFVDLESKEKIKKIEIQGCLMEDCEGLNYDTPGELSEYTDFELILFNYGDRDVFKAKYRNDEDIILFGKWNDGVI